MKFAALLILVALLLPALVTPVAADGGFDQYGYNYGARIFNGTGLSWCLAKGYSLPWCQGYLGPSIGDKLVMKWNAEWSRGNQEGWSRPPYAAWTTNEWNGMAGGSASNWHYKIVWVGPQLQNSPYWRAGGYAIWGQFEVIEDRGTDSSGHYRYAHAAPNGLGSGLY